MAAFSEPSDNMTEPVVCLQVSDHPESGPPTPAPTAGIVGALMEVMQKRSKAIHSSGDSPAALQLAADRYTDLYLCVCSDDCP